MSLELIIGPMFSGKTSELIRYANRYKSIGKNILIVNHIWDKKRTKSLNIRSHDGMIYDALFIEKMYDILENDNYYKADVILIEEAQFFNDLYSFISKHISFDKKFIVFGLSGGFNMQKLGQILDLIPLCDKLTKLDSFCIKCNDGTLAPFTKRIAPVGNKKDSEMVGGSGEYIAVCRKHYNEQI